MYNDLFQSLLSIPGDFYRQKFLTTSPMARRLVDPSFVNVSGSRGLSEPYARAQDVMGLRGEEAAGRDRRGQLGDCLRVPHGTLHRLDMEGKA